LRELAGNGELKAIRAEFAGIRQFGCPDLTG